MSKQSPWWLVRVDSWVPDTLADDERRRARVLVVLAALIVPWAPIIGGSLMALGEPLAGGAILMEGAMCLAIPFLVRRTGRVELGAHLLALGLVQGLLLSGTLLGGVGSPPTNWLALAPVLATITGGKRAGVTWTALVILGIVGVHVLQVNGFVPVPYLDGAWIYLGTVSQSGLFFLIGAFLWWNDTVYQRLLARLQQAESDARAADRAKSSFLANMSHEIRTPLNAILGYTEIVLEDIDAHAAEGEESWATQPRQDLRRVERSGRHLLGLVNDILDLSKIEAGKVEMSLETVPLDPLVQGVAEELLPLFENRGNSLELQVPDEVAVRADKLRLVQCVTNLLANAAKFTEQGAVRVTATVAGERVVLAVSDTGIGMNAEQLSRVFEPFNQATRETTAKFGGTGLGLPIARRLLTLMDGSLEAESTPGEGSTFKIELPTG